jgi:4'-phosphopantetheinyl transferase
MALVSMDDHLDPSAFTLTQAEVARRSAFRRPLDAHRFIQLRLAARLFAARELDLEARSLTIEQSPCPACNSDEHGPPRLVSSGQMVPGSFSLSRSQHRGVVFFSDTPQSAIDIEHVRQEGVSAIASVLSGHERRSLRDLDEESRTESLYRLWTAKEAVLKALGVGLIIDPALVSVVTQSDNVLQVELLAEEYKSHWVVHSEILQENLALAVASPA